MLISFSVENFLSFKDKVSFSMVASREKQHSDRVPDLKGYMRLLPIAAIYGGNASGKTNFFKAINFARHFVVQGSQPEAHIPVEPFRLDPRYKNQPSTFVFELWAGEKCYEYGFSLSSKRVVTEWLIEVLKTTEKEIFRRQEDRITLGGTLQKDQKLNFLFQGTRENQLFLTNAVSQKDKRFLAIYKWFRDSLVLIAPDYRFQPFDQFIQPESPLHDFMNESLGRMDTGICRLGGEPIPLESLLIPADLQHKIQEVLPEGSTICFRVEPTGDRYIFTRSEGEIQAKKLTSYHIDANQKEIKFDLRDESDGTLRMIDLLPAFLAISQPETSHVFIIDELDRSLHTLLTRQLLESYLIRCSEKSRSQLLFTTHDVLLMDQDLLRRDEMWVAERDQSGGSELIAFSEYKEVRSDKDIRKSYLQGRFGGIPRLLLTGRKPMQQEQH